MRDWNAYADHLRSLREQDPAGVFVGADVVLELIEERCMLIRTMVRIVHGEDDLCRYCANSTPDACMMHGGTCDTCPSKDCVCMMCDEMDRFIWAGVPKDPAPVFLVSDEPAAPSDARWVIAMLSDGGVMPLQTVERPGLDTLQAMVGGNIETLEFRIPGRGVRFVGVFDEEGKLKDLPVNELATREFMVERSCLAGDYLAGTVLLLKIEGEDIVGLTTEETAMLMRCLDKEWEAQV